MTTTHLTPTDWREFSRRFPHAVAFLKHRELQRELLLLRRLNKVPEVYMNKWRTNRLQELEALDYLKEGPIPYGPTGAYICFHCHELFDTKEQAKACDCPRGQSIYDLALCEVNRKLAQIATGEMGDMD